MNARSLAILLSFACLASALAGETWWSLRPPISPALPAARDQWLANEIDVFILDRLRAEGLEPSPGADRVTLARRVHLDLLGLPPSPEDVATFLADSHPAAYERLADRLLASSRHGERWAQHWLDVVRYADTHGFEVNTPRPNAWPYRDYVIRAFNADLPYDQFVREQLAGDQHGADEATGFLVTAAALLQGQVGQDEESIRLAHQDSLNEILINTGAAFLGMTLACARCHDHKFDPISQKDYFQMQAMFAGVRYGERPWRNADGGDQPARLAAVAAQLRSLDQQLRARGFRAPVNPRHNEESFAPHAARFVRFTILDSSLYEPCLDELEIWTKAAPGQPTRNVALASAGAQATSNGDLFGSEIHRLANINDGEHGNSHSWIATEKRGGWVRLELAEPRAIDRVIWGRDREGRFTDRLPTKYSVETSLDGMAWRRVATSEDRLSATDVDVPEVASLLAERRQLIEKQGRLSQTPVVFAGTFQAPDKTFLLHRGDPMQPREALPPDVPGVFGQLGLREDAPEASRRAAVAAWLTQPDHPLTARVMANRLWQGHFGIGLVETASDFGKMGAPPSHPELLDWLAKRLVDGQWSLKRLHRDLVLSQTYRQGAVPNQRGLSVDGKNRLLWRFPARRLEAEAIRDAMLQASGALDFAMGGPGFLVFKPNDNYVRVYDAKEEFGPADWRRMIYAHRVRMAKDGVFGAFDHPDAGLVCPQRARSTTPIQALNLFNSTFVAQQAEMLAERARVAGTPAAQVERIFSLAFARLPEATEQARAIELIGQHGLTALARAVLNANEFLWMP